MPFTSINFIDPRTNLWNFSQKNFKNWRFWKSQFFWIGHFEFFFFKKKMKISPNLYDRMDGSKFWCFPWFPKNSWLCIILRYTVYNKILSKMHFLLIKSRWRVISISIRFIKSEKSSAVIQFYISFLNIFLTLVHCAHIVS